MTPRFKASTKNDYKAIKVWGKVGTEVASFVCICKANICERNGAMVL